MSERRIWLLGCCLALVIGLLAGWGPTSNPPGPWLNPTIQAQFSAHAEHQAIWQLLAKATWSDAAGWWHGPWTHPTAKYYRPLSSMIWWAEWRAFGQSAVGWSTISCLIGALGFVLLFALGWRLFALPGWWRLAAALLPCVLFGLSHSPEAKELGWLRAPIVPWTLVFWPAQPDIFSLTLVLASLLCLDRYLQSPARLADSRAQTARQGLNCLLAATLLAIAALLCKETAVVLAVMAPGLALWRRGWRSALSMLALYSGLVLVLLLLRSHWLPGAWGPLQEKASLGRMAYKFAWYYNERVTSLVVAGGWWIIPAALTNAAALGVILRTRLSWIWPALGAVVLCGVWAQLGAGNFMQVTLVPEFSGLCSATISAISLMALVLFPSGRLWLLAVWAVVATLPALHLAGPHYFYWPNCWWALFLAGVIVTLGQAAAKRCARQAADQPKPVAAEVSPSPAASPAA